MYMYIYIYIEREREKDIHIYTPQRCTRGDVRRAILPRLRRRDFNQRFV